MNTGDPGDEQPDNGPDLIANTRREAEMMAAARKPYADLIMRLEQEGRACRAALGERTERNQQLLELNSILQLRLEEAEHRITELNAIVKEQEEALRRVRVRHVPEFDIRGDIGA